MARQRGAGERVRRHGPAHRQGGEASGGLDATYHYYYNGQQLVETRNGSGNVLKQHVWGVTYIDELVQTALNDDPADGTEDDCESLYYALQDAHFNVLGMVDGDPSGGGALIERYEYTPYGQRTVYFSPGTNDTDAHAPTAISRRWTVGSTAQPYGLNGIGHQGLMHDEETGLVYNRARMLSPTLGRFMQRDPLGYVDGMSLYQYVNSRPIDWGDPYGTFSWLLNLIRPGIRGPIRPYPHVPNFPESFDDNWVLHSRKKHDYRKNEDKPPCPYEGGGWTKDVYIYTNIRSNSTIDFDGKFTKQKNINTTADTRVETWECYCDCWNYDTLECNKWKLEKISDIDIGNQHIEYTREIYRTRIEIIDGPAPPPGYV